MQDTVYSHGYAKMISREGSEWASWASWGLGGHWLTWTSQWITAPDPWDCCEDTTWPWLSSVIQALSFCVTVWWESSFFSSQTIKLKECDNTTREDTSPLGRCRRRMKRVRWRDAEATDNTGTPTAPGPIDSESTRSLFTNAVWVGSAVIFTFSQHLTQLRNFQYTRSYRPTQELSIHTLIPPNSGAFNTHAHTAQPQTPFF